MVNILKELSLQRDSPKKKSVDLRCSGWVLSNQLYIASLMAKLFASLWDE